MRAVRFDHYGPVDVLEVRDVETPTPGTGEVLVSVRTAGINPGEMAIRAGAMHERWPATFPSGQGSDFAGVITALGEGVDSFAIGDEVIGMSDRRSAQAESVAIAADRVIAKPWELSWDAAGALYVAGMTAVAMVRAVDVRPGDTVFVASAAGGVGILAAQLARSAGARVLGGASAEHHQELRRLGIEPIEYHGDLAGELRALVPEGLSALLDTHGSGYIELGLALGAAPERIDTIADFAGAARRPGVKTDGMAAVRDQPAALADLAQRLANGELVLPIEASYPLERVRDAYGHLSERHSFGKIVLSVGTW